MDASVFGCGAHTNSHIAQDAWTSREARMHINILELRKVQKPCKSFLPFFCIHRVLVMSDIITVFHTNKASGSAIRLSVC